MFDKLPDLIDPVYSSQHDKRFVARVNQERFPRLKQLLVSTEHDVEVDVHFYYHPQYKMHAFDMKLGTVFTLECQRSLKSFDYPSSSSVTGVFVESMALAEELPSDVEVYELSEEKISLMDLVEDELMLSVPLSAIDDASEMDYQNPPEEDALPEDKELEKKENPFAALKGLKDNPN
ncbi:YceD family protein [Thiomicrospira sp. XS5]|uniref:YceD family protein n=1 Tax=Thiomicrospira sp. XS5 TaxID=1775636 RepID=UPI00136605EA|nr:YceD family protein [Thiomicrospira sp. XS5]